MRRCVQVFEIQFQVCETVFRESCTHCDCNDILRASVSNEGNKGHHETFCKSVTAGNICAVVTISISVTVTINTVVAAATIVTIVIIAVTITPVTPPSPPHHTRHHHSYPHHLTCGYVPIKVPWKAEALDPRAGVRGCCEPGFLE